MFSLAVSHFKMIKPELEYRGEVTTVVHDMLDLKEKKKYQTLT